MRIYSPECLSFPYSNRLSSLEMKRHPQTIHSNHSQCIIHSMWKALPSPRTAQVAHNPTQHKTSRVERNSRACRVAVFRKASTAELQHPIVLTLTIFSTNGLVNVFPLLFRNVVSLSGFELLWRDERNDHKTRVWKQNGTCIGCSGWLWNIPGYEDFSDWMTASVFTLFFYSFSRFCSEGFLLSAIGEWGLPTL